MSAIKGFIYSCRRSILTIVFLIISLFLLFTTSNKQVISFSNLGMTIIYPFQFISHKIGDSLNDIVNAVSNIKKAEEEVMELRQELDQYRKMMVDFSVITRENSELRGALKLRDSLDYKTVTAQVVNRDPKRFFDYLIIDKGSNNGIKENMPVISYRNGKKALIGRINQVTPFSSVVITLNNPALNVGVIMDDKNTHAIVRGDINNIDTARLLYVPKSFSLNSQNLPRVYTSGDSMYYPKGIEIGYISEVVESKKYELYNEAVVKLAENFSTIEFVLILIVNYKIDDFNILETPY